MERWFKLGAVVMAIAVLVIAGLFWQRGLERSRENYATKFSLSHELVAARKPIGQPVAERLVIIVLEQIAKETLPEMPFLNALQSEGAYRPLISPPPHESKPTLAVLSSGAWPEINGVISDRFDRQIPADNLFRRIAEAGLSTALVGHRWWQQLNGPYFRSESLFYDGEKSGSLTDQQAFAAASELLQHSSADVFLIHFPGSDRPAGLDRLVENLAQALTWEADILLVITKDSLFAFGQRILPGVYGPAEFTDVAPTVAALLGIAAPTEAHGRILWDLLDLPANQRALLATSHSQYLAEFISAYVEIGGYQKIVRNLLSEAALLIDEAERFARAAMYEAAFRKAVAAESILIDTMHKVRQDLIWRGYWLRLPVVLLLSAGPVAGLRLLDGRRKILLAVGAVVQTGFFWLFYRLGAAKSTSLFLAVGIPAYLALGLVLAAVWGLRRLAEKTQLFSPLVPGYWSNLLDYSAALVGVFAGLLLTALLAFLATGSKLIWYFPQPALLALGKLMVSQALYLLPAVITPLIIAYWDNIPKETSSVD